MLSLRLAEGEREGTAPLEVRISKSFTVREEKLSRLSDVIRERLNLSTVPTRDYLLSGICAVIGFFVSFLPTSRHEWDQPSVHEWIRLYVRGMKYMTTGPWILLTIVVCVLLLISARFKRGGLGVAYCLGILLGHVINSGW